jgi:hypothetical protein
MSELTLAWMVVQALAGFTAAYVLFVLLVEAFVWLLDRYSPDSLS